MESKQLIYIYTYLIKQLSSIQLSFKSHQPLTILRNQLKMESRRRAWEEMGADCLVEIFIRLGVGDLTLAVPFVCRSWLAAALHPLCWRKLDFRRLDLLPWSNFSKSFTELYSLPYFSFTYLLKLAVERSCNSVTELRFPLKSTSTEDLVFASNECLKLKSVAMPALSEDDGALISELVCNWKDLELLEMESKPHNFTELAKDISLHCSKFSGLVVSGKIREEDALAIVSHLPKLKKLDMSRSYLPKEVLLIILNGCKELERLEVDDCIGFHVDDKEIIAKASHIRDFKNDGCKLYCEDAYDSDDWSNEFCLSGYVL